MVLNAPKAGMMPAFGTNHSVTTNYRLFLAFFAAFLAAFFFAMVWLPLVTLVRRREWAPA